MKMLSLAMSSAVSEALVRDRPVYSAALFRTKPSRHSRANPGTSRRLMCRRRPSRHNTGASSSPATPKRSALSSTGESAASASLPATYEPAHKRLVSTSTSVARRGVQRIVTSPSLLSSPRYPHYDATAAPTPILEFSSSP